MAKGNRIQLPMEVYLQIAQRDKWTCRVCEQGYKPLPEWKWEIDHWIALAKGGTNHLSNLVLAHQRCNRDKAAA